MAALKIGAFTLTPLQRTTAIEGQTAAGAWTNGTGRLYDLTGPDALHLTVRDTSWDNGERDVVACERHDSPAGFDTLVERLRLTVQDYGGPYLELRQARVRDNGRAGLFNPDPAVLDAGAGVDVRAVLLSHGATAVGTREELTDDGGPARHRLGVHLGPAARGTLAAIADLLMRVAPVANDVSA